MGEKARTQRGRRWQASPQLLRKGVEALAPRRSEPNERAHGAPGQVVQLLAGTHRQRGNPTQLAPGTLEGKPPSPHVGLKRALETLPEFCQSRPLLRNDGHNHGRRRRWRLRATIRHEIRER